MTSCSGAQILSKPATVKGFKGAKVQIDQFPPVGQPSYAVALGQAASFIGKLSAAALFLCSSLVCLASPSDVSQTEPLL